jgi:glycosyltransferase involved in cell wall biosynthesis
MRVLIISLSTYSSPYNDGPLEELGRRLEAVTAVAGDVTTLWGGENRARSGPGYDVFVLPLRFARSIAMARLHGLDELANAMRQTIIHAECEPWQGVALQSVKLAHRLGVPVGVHLPETGPRLNGPGGRIRRATGSWVLKRCDYAVGWSTASTRVAERLAPGIRTETFPATGVSLTDELTTSSDRWFGPRSQDLPKVAFVGRFAKEKGIDDFLWVCDELARRRPLRAALAGGQGIQEKVRQWAADRSWANLHGLLPRTKVRALLGAADAVVCPSRTTSFWEEQFGKGAVEAMGAGTPVFAYDSGALAEVIGRGGIVVPEGAQAQLVDELERYFAGSAIERASLAGEARRQATQFTDEAIATKCINLWSSYRG